MRDRLVIYLGALAFSIGFAAPVEAQSPVAQFYSGKQIKLVIGASAGGGYDAYGRLIARFWGKHIPGNPAVIPTNMPGAGSDVAAQYLFAGAPKDGTFAGALYANALTDPLFGDPSRLNHDPSKFIYLGNANREVFFCAVRGDAGIGDFNDVMTREVVLGATADGGSTRDYPTVERSVLGAKFRLVTGYPGANEVYLALEKGEVQGACGLSWANFVKQHSSWVKSGFVRPLVQEDAQGHPVLDAMKVPKTIDYAKSPEERSVLDLVYAQSVFGRPYVLPPGVPQERAAALREAFMQTLADKELLAEAAELGLDITASSGEELQSLIAKLYSEPKALVERAKEALEHNR